MIASLQQRVYILCVLLVGVTVSVEAQDLTLEARVDSIFSRWNGTDRPGASVAYFDRGQTVFKKAYGLANLEHKIVMSTSSVSDLASVSKQFIGFATALLAEQGHFSLDDDIRTYLPDIPDFGETITIRHLLHHTSGLREIYATLALVNWRSGDAIFQEHAQRLVSFQEELQFSPGSRYLYNNTEYMLLADLIEVVTGTEFHEWMAHTLFEPLEMHDTTIMHRQGQVIPHAATSYASEPDGSYWQIYDNSTVQGAGGIYSTVEDLGKWMLNFSEHTVGSQKTVDSMIERGVLSNGDTLDYALGIVVGKVNGIDVWQHSGASAGYRSFMYYLPEFQRGWVFLSNTPPGLSTAMIESISTVFLGDVIQFPGSGASEEDEEEAAPVTVSDPEHYTGKYLSDELEVFYEIKWSEGGLHLVHRWLNSYAMSYRGDDVFELDGGPSTLTVIRDRNDEVSGFILDVGRTTGVRFNRYPGAH